ncbi:unnamed protein product [Caenorhabditis brenneri]
MYVDTKGSKNLCQICLFAVGYDNKEKTRDEITGLQHLWIVPSGIIFAEFARVWLVGVQLINVNGERNEVVAQSEESRRAVESESFSKTAAPKPSCNICSIPYTETGIHTPKLIKECGHTICEQCASKLLNAKCPKLLVCPFCQEPTIVNGPAGTLPKNFALLEYRREVVQQPSCNICCFPYTETGINTPRMLRECGHTICEQCASKLLNVKMQNRLVCPFCQKPTIVNGSAESLPKNFALLEYRRDVVQRN